VLADLKIAAYAQGANGITNVRIVKKSGLPSNCWHIWTAEPLLCGYRDREHV